MLITPSDRGHFPPGCEVVIGGNPTRTAGQLKIGSATLYRKLKSYGLIRDRSSVRGPGDAPVIDPP